MRMKDKVPIYIGFELRRSTKGSQNLRSGNEMISSNDRLNYHVKSELTQHLRLIGNQEGRQRIGDMANGEHQYSKKNPCHIVVHVHPPSARRMDAPNWYPTIKPLIDGLTDAGMFEDDNNDVITAFIFLPGPKTDNKKYFILLEVRDGPFV